MAREGPPQATDVDSDADSAIGAFAESDTTSLASWTRNYREENGRTYHSFKEGKYWGPNDEEAQNHLDIAHHLFTLTFDGQLFLAPISPNVQNVLDVGTGTGIWAMDFADNHPSALVVGIDLSPIQPTWVAPNLKFEVDDCEDEWLFPDNHFDYIHIRSLLGCVKDWPRLYAQALRCLLPGGYLEHTEYAPRSNWNIPTSDDIFGEFGRKAIDSERVTGRTFEVMYHMFDWISAAGFQDVAERRFKWPLGRWPKDPKLKELGSWARAHADAGLESWSLAILTRISRWSHERIMAHIEKTRAGLYDPNVHKWHEMRVVYGMKKLE